MNFDNWERIQEWFINTYQEKQLNGNAKILLFDGHVNKPTRGSELFSLGGRETKYNAEPDEAFQDFMKEISFYLRNFPKKFTVAIGHPEGGAPKRFKIVVVEPGTESQQQQVGMAGIGGFGGIGNIDQYAKLAFDNYKHKFEIEQRDKQIEQLLTAKPDSRIGRLLDNLVEAIATPEVIQGLTQTLQQYFMRKAMNPGVVQSAGFASPAAAAANQEQVNFRSKFADYGETIKQALFNNEQVVFNVMDNLIEILKSPEKVNALIAYINELNQVDGRFENPSE